MQKTIFIGILALFTQFGHSQERTEPNPTKKNMEKTSILGLRTTIYKVNDIEKARDWYEKAFETKAYFDEPYYVGFNIGGYELGLQPEEGAKGEKIESVVSYWGVEKIQEVYDRLIALGATENEKPYDVGGEIMTATVKDPFGNVIGLIYNPHFKLKG
ncbi:VOC family protein [Galbibacter sp. EGI 63066]|uniref:VOC family protein n=1 Tax=Galbibacter sp. EGI 63066 TaxID=2993559 RepID=UPI00224888A9|nr:VOC family protein [Galbibacter sp. EGI 63066]MCX2680933.1 VOC family protein [Galbibacter sp. EGI 63066]